MINGNGAVVVVAGFGSVDVVAGSVVLGGEVAGAVVGDVVVGSAMVDVETSGDGSGGNASTTVVVVEVAGGFRFGRTGVVLGTVSAMVPGLVDDGTVEVVADTVVGSARAFDVSAVDVEGASATSGAV